MSEIGEDHAVPIDPLGVSQLEVVRGPATLRWGSQAIGGVVNATNGRIPEKLPCPDNATPEERKSGCKKVETRSALSIVDAGTEGGVLADAGVKNFAVHADIWGRRASNYAIPGYPYQFPPEPPPPVDGRQPNYSEGVSIAELAQIVIDYDGYTALNLDGGGSVTLVVEGADGEPEILNSPIHNRIPGRERPVANHFGIYAQGD